jgi:hypothetical protein
VHLGLPFIPGPGSAGEIKSPSWLGRDADERPTARRLGHPIGDGLPPFEMVRSFLCAAAVTASTGPGRARNGLVIGRAEDVEAEIPGLPNRSVMVGARRVDKSLDAFRTDADVDEHDVHRFSRFGD